MTQILDFMGQSHIAGILVILVGATAITGLYLIKRRLEKLHETQEMLESAMSVSSRLNTLEDVKDALAISETAVGLLDQFREELSALQFIRGANTEVIGRLDTALATLHEMRPDPQDRRSAADALERVERDVKEMRVAYAATCQQLDEVTSALAERNEAERVEAKRIEAERDAAQRDMQRSARPSDNSGSEYHQAALAARQALEEFERDGRNPL